jgi:23S rRNA pseudouridine1911/1915/1917 synthase
MSPAPEDAGRRLDAFLAERHPDLSRSRLADLVTEGAVTVNGKTVKPSYKVQTGDEIALTLPEVRPTETIAQAIPLDVLYEDAELLVVNKPKGMATHPAPGSPDKTLVNALLAHCTDLSGIGGEERPGIVHRLDKDTTGLLVVAKTDFSHAALQKQIQSREAKRRYLALVWGSPKFEEAVIDAPIGRHPTDRVRMAALKTGGRDAVTEVFVRERLGPCTLLECRLQTGRTHQIRVHCQLAGHPVVGDPLYGGLKKSGNPELDRRVGVLTGQALHAYFLGFTHPRTGEVLALEAPLPGPFAELLAFLKAGADGH